MIDFSTTTAFGLVRRMTALGPTSPSIYLLICKPADIDGIQSDITSEVAVQLGIEIQSLEASVLFLEQLLKVVPQNAPRVLVLPMRKLDQRLVESLDRNVILLTRAGQILILTTSEVAQRLLSAAPNLRNRLADVLVITEDEALVGGLP